MAPLLRPRSETGRGSWGAARPFSGCSDGVARRFVSQPFFLKKQREKWRGYWAPRVALYLRAVFQNDALLRAEVARRGVKGGLMKTGLLGYGKMGRAVEAQLLARGHEVVWRVGRSGRAGLTAEQLRQADVVVEFSRPEAAYENVLACLEAGVAVVSGTTGWAEQLPLVEAYCRAHGGAMLWASNFSLGVNLFFALNRYLARLMGAWLEYRPSVEETHHVHKLDAPSGTARTLAEELLAAAGRLERWALACGQPLPPEVLPVVSIRRGEVPGTHVVRWDAEADTLEIRHTAHNRSGFALGAVLAAEWLLGRQGVFRMSDVLNLEGP